MCVITSEESVRKRTSGAVCTSVFTAKFGVHGTSCVCTDLLRFVFFIGTASPLTSSFYSIVYGRGNHYGVNRPTDTIEN